MSEIAGVLAFLAVMAWLFSGGLALAFLAEGTKKDQMSALICGCLFLAPFMAGVALFFHLRERPKPTHKPLQEEG